MQSNKENILNLLKYSRYFSENEKQQIPANWDKLPAEFVDELEKMLINEKDETARIENEFEKDVEEAMKPLRESLLKNTKYSTEEAEEFLKIMKQNYINAARGGKIQPLIKDDEPPVNSK